MTKVWPRITDEERARMVEDLSDAAVQRWASEMRARDGDHELEAVERAEQYRAMYPASSPKASFWSRVIVELLAPKRGPVCTCEATGPNPPACVVHAAEWFKSNGLVVVAEPAPAPSSCTAYPTPGGARRDEDDGEQLSLF